MEKLEESIEPRKILYMNEQLNDDEVKQLLFDMGRLRLLKLDLKKMMSGQ
jgi:hypothetical protein